MTTPDIVIRPERPDQPEIAGLLRELDAYLGSLYAPQDNHILGVQALLAPEVVFLAARAGGAAVGCGAARRMPGEAATGGVPYGEIKRMYVRPGSRRHRIGARLLLALEDSLLRQGLGRSLLETGRDQTEALQLYERAGYARRGPFAGYPDNGLSLFYEKRLA
jgi:putative acetyltransferase